jgi:hypothetical protein
MRMVVGKLYAGIAKIIAKTVLTMNIVQMEVVKNVTCARQANSQTVIIQDV